MESGHNDATPAGTLSVDETHVPTEVSGSVWLVAYEDEMYLVTVLVPCGCFSVDVLGVSRSASSHGGRRSL